MDSASSPTLIIVGLDCLAPGLVFERWPDRLPTFRRLMDEGLWGPLRSTDPPITVPAWAAMFSGRDPGELGLYGFKHRRERGYFAHGLPTSDTVRWPRLWDLAGAAGIESLVLGVPQTWPPPEISGRLVSGFLCPGEDLPHTWPPALAAELAARAPGYRFDVEGYRGRPLEAVRAEAEAMTDQRLELFEAWTRQRRERLAVWVEIALDRMHHCFWGDWDVLEAYYRRLDGALARLLEARPDAWLMVVSDHGAQAMEGGVALNEWLRARGDLVLRSPPPGPNTPLSRCEVDWGRTRAWAEGGYAGRVHLNLRGRDPEGCVAPEDAPALLAALRAGLEAELGATCFTPDERYRAAQGVPPDLTVYLEGMRQRALGTLGGPLRSPPTGEGADAANHDFEGVFLLRPPGGGAGQRLEGLEIYDVFATACALLGLPQPAGTLGTPRLPS